MQGLRFAVAFAPAVSLFAGLSLVTSPQAGLANELCVDGTAACSDAYALTEDHLRRRLNRTLAVGPAKNRADRLNVPGTAAVMPFAMTPDGTNANFATSLSQWRSSLSAADAAKLKEAAEVSGETLPVPQLPRQAVPKLDFWAEGRREAFTQSGTKEGSGLTTFVGADYRVDNDLLIGGLVQLDEGRQTVLAAPEAAKGTAYMAGPYLAYRVTPHVLLDAKAAWGTAQDTAVTGAGSTAFGTDRMLGEAKVTGQWGWQGWQLSQSGAITHLNEKTSLGMTGLDGTSVDVTRLSVGPEVKRRFEAGENASIAPFAFFKSSVDVSNQSLTDAGALNTIGGGVTFANPDSFNIRATADYSENTDSDASGVGTGRVQINVPTSNLGF